MAKPTDVSQTQHTECSPDNSIAHSKEDILPSSDSLKNTSIPEDTETSTAERPANGSDDHDSTPNISIQKSCDGTPVVQRCSSPLADTPKYTDNEGNDTCFQEGEDDLKYKTGDGSAVSETKENLTNFMSEMGEKLNKIENWTKEEVRDWLIKVMKISPQYTDILNNEDASGAAHVLAVQILKAIAQYKTSSDALKNSAEPKDTAPLVETSSAGRPCSESNELEITPNISVQEKKDGISSVQRWSLPSHSCVNRSCNPRPFDESCPTFEYTQNEILPPETGPSNLIDPVHEYKLLANTENTSEEDVLKKFTNDTFRFAAGCMNSRTNGTIHFGVGDEPQYKHGQIIGIEVTSLSRYVDAFDKDINVYFKNNISIVKRCIRPPKFCKVNCPDNIHVDKWVIEIDVVPMYGLTVEERFYTAFDKKGRKSKSFFIRDGASTINYIPENDPKRKTQNEKNLNRDVEIWASSRKLTEDIFSASVPSNKFRLFPPHYKKPEVT